MAAKEDGAAGGDALQEQLLQRPLHQRVKSFGGLIKNEELWICLQRLYDTDLLAHAAAVVAHRSLQDRIGELERLHHAMAQE